MKKMRTVVSTLLLVCLLASMLAVSASAEAGVSITYATAGGVSAGGSYTITTDEGIKPIVYVTLPEDYEGTYSLVWKFSDGTIARSATPVDAGVAIDTRFTGSQLGEGTHTIIPYIQNDSTGATAAQAGGFTVTVTSAVPALTGVHFNTDFIQLERNGEKAPVYAVLEQTGAEGTITYWFEDVAGSTSPVASYDSTNQTVRASGQGTTYLWAKAVDKDDNKFYAKTQISVTNPVTSIKFDTKYLKFDLSEGTKEIEYNVYSDNATWPQLQWTSSNPSVATATGKDGKATVTAKAAGTATITATSTDGSAVYFECIVTVTDTNGNGTLVTVTPANADLVIGDSITLTAYVSGVGADKVGSYFTHWYCTSNAVSITHDGNVATITAKSTTSSPIEVRAYANDGKYGYALINISKSEALELSASATTVKSGKTVTISVDNARNNETFKWSYSPSDVGFVSNAYEKGNNFCIVGGDLEGSITVTCTSNNDSSRTASVLLGINSVDPYGNAYILPKSVNWTRGSGDLTFQISPAAYWTYLDNQYLNTKSTSLASYWNGTLTLKSAYLNTLSNGTHTLKVYTAYDEYNNPTGLVYANIYISGNGTSASATYGDNAHVKGTASNLYFNSGNAISDVYISGKWIDPANYSLSTDGKTLTLNSSFLNQLSYGTYTMNLNGTNGSTQSTTFRIVTANYAPSTGDETNIGLWVAIMILSGAGAIALIPRRKNMMQ